MKRNDFTMVEQTINVKVDLTCGVQNFGLIPQFLDYSLEVLPPNNNGFENPIILARHAIPAGALSDSITTTVRKTYVRLNIDTDITALDPACVLRRRGAIQSCRNQYTQHQRHRWESCFDVWGCHCSCHYNLLNGAF